MAFTEIFRPDARSPASRKAMHVKKIGKEPNTQNDLMFVLNCVCLAIYKVNLTDDTVTILQHAARPEDCGSVYPWTDYLRENGSEVCGDSPQFLASLSRRELLANFTSGKSALNLAFTDREAKITFNQYHGGDVFAYLVLNKSGKDDILKQIINLYVFNSCDYFIYLDTQQDTYIMFSGSTNGTPLPPAYCKSYSTEIIRYAEDYVVPEDRDMVIREMTLDRVLASLDEKGVHTIYCGVIEPEGYARKRLEYRYCDSDKRMVLLSRSDITEIYRAEQKRNQELQSALERAYTDSLTGLLNQQGMMTKASALLRDETEQAALLFFDLDNFKAINDTYGHPAGDALLKNVAALLRSKTRSCDLLSRYGGDEFIIYLHNIHSEKTAEEIAWRICQGIEALSCGEEARLFITSSIGIAFAPQDGQEYTALVGTADRRLYRAKASGKNRVITKD